VTREPLLRGERRAALEDIGRAALDAVDARAAVARVLRPGPPLEIAGRPVPGEARLLVLALGKAAAGMLAAVVDAAGDRIARGLVVTKDGHADGLCALPVREAGHPVPDLRGEVAARDLLSLARGSRPEDVLLVLLSGGASALTSCPADGLTQEDLAATTKALLAGGADIAETNAVRKHLSAFSGGRLAEVAQATRIEVLAISDVPGDALEVIGSGPCAPDATTFADAQSVLARRTDRAAVPEAVHHHLATGARGILAETAKPGDPGVSRARHTIVASNRDAVAAAAVRARAKGFRPVVLGEVLRGEARVAGQRLAALGCGTASGDPVCYVAGGETVVALQGDGKGGRNQELALAAAVALDAQSSEEAARVGLLALGTDGTDGPTDAAGAYADAGTVRRGREAGVDALAALSRNDAYPFFQREGGLLVTGPTGTNVMDLVLMLA